MFRRGCRSPNRKNASCSDKKADTYQIRVPLKLYDPSQVKISVNDRALMTISATSEIEKETDRNGMRKSINILEETIQLPDYLLSDLDAVADNVPENKENENDDNMQTSTSKNSSETKKKLISKVTTKFERGFLIITVPNQPEEKKPKEKKEKKRTDNGPVDIEIEFVKKCKAKQYDENCPENCTKNCVSLRPFFL